MRSFEFLIKYFHFASGMEFENFAYFFFFNWNKFLIYFINFIIKKNITKSWRYYICYYFLFTPTPGITSWDHTRTHTYIYILE